MDKSPANPYAKYAVTGTVESGNKKPGGMKAPGVQGQMIRAPGAGGAGKRSIAGAAGRSSSAGGAVNLSKAKMLQLNLQRHKQMQQQQGGQKQKGLNVDAIRGRFLNPNA